MQGLLLAKEEELSEVGRIIRTVFVKLTLSPLEGIPTVDIRSLYAAFPHLGLVPGQAEDVTFAIDMLLAALPPSLSETLQLSGLAHDETSLFISDTCKSPMYSHHPNHHPDADIQASCRNQGSLSQCLDAAGVLLLEAPAQLMLRLGKDVEDASGRIHRAFDPVDLSEILQMERVDAPAVLYRLDGVAVNAAGGHYNCYVRNLWSGCWTFCDDAHCQRVSGGFEAVASGAARTHGLVFLYRRLEMEAGGTETATVRLEPRLTEGILQW